MKLSWLVYERVPDLADLARRFERAAALGYQGIELSASWPTPYPISEIAALSRRHKLPVVSLLSGWSYVHEGLCLSVADAGVRERAVARLIDYVGHAAECGAPVLVVGMMQGLLSDEPDPVKAGERIVACLRRVAAVADGAGVSVVLEPVNHMQVGFHNTAAEAAAVAGRVGSPAMGYMLDTIHMCVEEKSVVDVIRAHGRQIRHFHLCETNGGPFGAGHLDFRQIASELDNSGYRGFASVKIYRKAGWEEAMPAAIEFLRKRQIV